MRCHLEFPQTLQWDFQEFGKLAQWSGQGNSRGHLTFSSINTQDFLGNQTHCSPTFIQQTSPMSSEQILHINKYHSTKMNLVWIMYQMKGFVFEECYGVPQCPFHIESFSFCESVLGLPQKSHLNSNLFQILYIYIKKKPHKIIWHYLILIWFDSI